MCCRAEAPTRPEVVRNSSPEVGLHQSPTEKKGQGEPVRGRPVPSHVPTHAQPPPRRGVLHWVRGRALVRMDSPQEERRFEPLVPPTNEAALRPERDRRSRRKGQVSGDEGPEPPSAPVGGIRQSDLQRTPILRIL